ncbi:MAG: hypothetical protein PHP98_00965 [Kiritimatiellae bacterium]|nr:hypothetical protein [Kiritimatiellia bacterium]
MNHDAPGEGIVAAGKGGEDIETIDFISLGRGFSRMFWGLALAAVLFLSQAKFEFFANIRLPACFLGIAFYCWGLLTLLRAGKISSGWNFHVGLALLLALLEIYFFPFVRWWRAMPYVSFFTFNVGALAAAVIVSLYLSNIIAADFFNRLSLKKERLESRIYAGTVAVFMALPLLAAVVLANFSARRYQTMFLDELAGLAHDVPIWLYIIVTVPYSLTLAVLWKARDRSYQKFYQAGTTS